MYLREVRELGQGGFGVVHHVVDETGQDYARKTFQPAQNLQAEQIEQLRKRFVREVRIQGELGGNEVIPVIHSELNGAAPWFLMPLATKSYHDQLQEDRRTGSIAFQPITDILDALHYLHDMEYVHRDLNPKNVLLHDGRWKLSDFGAVLPPAGQTQTLTANTAIFTELYCAPEQRQNFHNARPAADIYSFGCILHDAFSSAPRRPYAKHSIAGSLGPIVEKCTQERPERRPSIAVVREAVLEEFLQMGELKVEPGTESADWLEKLSDIPSWTDDDFDRFCHFFGELDLSERTAEHQVGYVYALSTPFLTRIPPGAMAQLASRGDGPAEAIIEKYCDWVRNTDYSFPFVDSVCSRLVAIFDHGSPSFQALAMAALVHLASGHNRYFAMRQALARCVTEVMPDNVAKRTVLELKSDELVEAFRHCVTTIEFDSTKLASPLTKLIDSDS